MPAQAGFRLWNPIYRRRTTAVLFVFALAVAAVYFSIRTFVLNVPVVYNDVQDHFKYGSIGSEPVNGIPYWIWQVLPDLFPEKLPGKGYASLGFIYEPGRDLPIGISERRVIINRIGLNCAICHTGTVRDTPDSTPRIVLGMPANNFDLQRYTRFLFACVEDGRFTADNVLRAINQRRHLNFVDRFIYRQAVWETREGLLEHKQRLAFEDSRPDWGPGRVETWNPSYKALQFNFPMEKDATLGAVDLPSIWNQKPREEMHMHLHWDGNNTLLAERNRIAALGAGVTPTTIDLKSMQRIEDWLLHQLQPPPYAYPIDRSLAAKGAALYDRYCATCHAFNGSKVGQVVPISEIGTDPHRLESFTYELDVNMNTLYAGYPWRLSHLRKTNGYTNVPLDGIWLRAPYLHNGSVPTLRDLLEPPEKRPRVFYRGYDVLDTRKVGFISDVAQEKGRKYFRYDTALPGNGNGGHLYGTGLAADEKDALVEYMKKL